MTEKLVTIKDKLDSVTDMLCRILRYAEENTFADESETPIATALLELHPGLPFWWHKHKKADQRRKAVEEAEHDLKRAEAKLRELKAEDAD